MPTVEHSTQVSVPIQSVWAFVRDMGNWAPFLTGYQRHEELGPDDSIWVVKGELGGLSRTAEFRVHVTEWREPTRVTFTMEGLQEPVTGSGEFRAIDLAGEAVPPPAPSVAPRGGWFARLLDRLSRWLLRRATNSVDSVETAAVVGGQTQIVFSLSVSAGGMAGPVLNLLLEPMLKPVAEDLANKIAAAVEGQAA